MPSSSRSGGFAIGLILLVIVLMAAISTAMSIGSRGNFGLVDADRARGYAQHLRSQANAVKTAIDNLRARGLAMEGINRAWGCSGTNCLQAAIQNSRFLNDVFAAAPPAVTHSYQQWANDTNAVFQNGLELDVYVLRQQISGGICAAIQSAAVGRVVTIQNVPVLTEEMSFNNRGDPPTVVAELDARGFIPSGQDGCVRGTNGATTGFYYFVVGKACGGDTTASGYWPCP